jgi:hypothetical protein
LTELSSGYLYELDALVTSGRHACLQASPAKRGFGVDDEVIRFLEPWMSSLWVVLFPLDKGNRCEGDFHTILLNTHNLEHVNTSRFGCASTNVSMTDKKLGMEMTFTEEVGHREVREVQ